MSAGNGHHDNPTQHDCVDLQAEDNSVNTRRADPLGLSLAAAPFRRSE